MTESISNNYLPNDFLINKDCNKTGFQFRLKILKVNDQMFFVKDLDFTQKSFYLPKNKIELYRPLTPSELKELHQDLFYRFWLLNSCKRIVTMGIAVQKLLNLNHSKAPRTFKNYLGNWLAYLITFATRIECAYYDNNPQKKFNIQKLLLESNSHGPLWKGQKIY